MPASSDVQHRYRLVYISWLIVLILSHFSWNVSYDSLFGTNKRFPQPIPLSDMVDFLADIWEHEGLYD
ncbi:hypothetical protein H5410_035405 [Solanum commersonii]|uniref:Gag1-like clamp domain-containing protein n=1 Tax=Solanum commersonii TaxID=4109 RepID=A0A9J5Y1T5_SOLCO|nr:hypothetical protein H5410_035405 [Solanum commersonii]